MMMIMLITQLEAEDIHMYSLKSVTLVHHELKLKA